MSAAEDRRPGLIGRALRAAHRLVHPDYPEERARLEAYARKVDRVADAQRELITALRGEVAALSARVAQAPTRTELRAVDESLDELRDAALRQYRVTSQAVRFAGWQEELRVVERRLKKRLARLAKRREPIVIGPWTGEVGFELLYWVPFVTRAIEQAGVDRARLVIVSRGGAEPWYAHLGGRYIDILSYISPDEFRAATEIQKKQRKVGAFDRQILRRVIAEIGKGRVLLLHPGLMYPLFMPVWKQQATTRRVEEYATHRLMQAMPLPELAGRLPAEYVAVRFYFSACFPDSPANRCLVDSVVTRLAQSHHVVLLNSGIAVDDHRDFAPAALDRIHTVHDLMRPERNLDVQTAVIARAKAFVGTYGGYSYLAPLCGVDSLAFYSTEEFHVAHLELAQRVFRRLRAGSLVALDVRNVDLLSRALAVR